jgi:hypothetical protein
MATNLFIIIDNISTHSNGIEKRTPGMVQQSARIKEHVSVLLVIAGSWILFSRSSA